MKALTPKLSVTLGRRRIKNGRGIPDHYGTPRLALSLVPGWFRLDFFSHGFWVRWGRDENGVRKKLQLATF